MMKRIVCAIGFWVLLSPWVCAEAEVIERVERFPSGYLPVIGPSEMRYEAPEFEFNRNNLEPLIGDYATGPDGSDLALELGASDGMDFAFGGGGQKTTEDTGSEGQKKSGAFVMETGPKANFDFLDDSQPTEAKINPEDFYLFLKEDIPVKGGKTAEATLPFKLPASSTVDKTIPSQATYTRQ